MAEEQSPRSLKLIAVLLVGACLAVFTAIIFFIFNNSMANMLERAEDKYLEKQLDAVAGSFAAAKRNAYLMAEDMGNWNAAVLFVKGQNPGFIQDNWPDNSMLQSYRFNLVVIKDLHNADRYVAFHDYLRDKDLPTPQGFTRSLDRLAIEALEQARQPQAPVSDAERYTGGILFFENVPYFVAAAPILSQRESGDPAGTVFFGIRLDNEYFRHLTHYNTVTFTLVKAEGGVDSGNKRGSRKAPETVSATLPLRDIDGDSVLLHMGDNRTIFLEGQSILNRATVLLFFVQLLLAMALYQIFMRVILRPVEQLSRDMKHVASLGDIEGKNYSTSREFEALCSSINDMVRRLNESKVSMDVLLNILNGLDAYLFVCDPHTD
ncbi:MAG: HAMP domain-containing protein, partial [Deltaproteobacteria bacterium]|nr:HAMP domain-containing protein [Deltaproteobacteria bacterium]